MKLTYQILFTICCQILLHIVNICPSFDLHISSARQVENNYCSVQQGRVNSAESVEEVSLKYYLAIAQPNLTLTQLYVRFDMNITVHTNHSPPKSQCQQYLSCYLPDFQVGSWNPLEQIPTVMVTFVRNNICPGNICPYKKYVSY